MNILKKLWSFCCLPSVKSGTWAFLKVLGTAALTTLGVSTLSGCGTMQTPSSKSQTSSVYAFGLPAVVITHDNKQVSDNSGDDDNFAHSAK